MKDSELKIEIINKIQFLDSFIRDLEDFSKKNKIKYTDEKIYIAAIAQKNVLRELI